MMRRWWVVGLFVLVAVGLGAWLGPDAVALYRQERGGQLLDQALAAEGYDTAQESWPLLWEPLTRDEAHALTERAAARFRAAVAADPDHAQAHRWLGRTSLLLDEPREAAEAFSAYVRQRPDNPLGYWELGLAYERLARELEHSVYWQFDAGLDTSYGSSIVASDMVTTSLPMADVETPDVPIDTPYCEQGDAPTACFVAATDWAMPDAPQEPLWTPDGDVRRGVLFMHPPAQATFTPTLPVTPTALAFWMGINPTVWDWMGDGVVYRVAVDGREVFTHALTAEQARQGWQPARVDLGEWAGETVRLTLTTDPGPHGDGGGDWAGWGDVRVVAGDGVPWAWVQAAWEEGGITTQDLIDVGEEARAAERWEEALGWYEWAVRVAPGLGDPWYYMGLTYEGMEQWEEALEAYARALGADRLGRIGESSPYYRMGVIYHWELESRETAQALEALEESIELGAFRNSQESADAHYRRGLILEQQGEEPVVYTAEFERAVEIHPEHVGAHVLLGVSYYVLYEDVMMAEEEIGRALDLNPQNRWAYLHLGDVYREAGLCEEAKLAYTQALEIDPSFDVAVARLEITCEPR